MRDIKFRAWVDGFDTPFHAPQNDWSLSLHDTGHKLLMCCSDGIVDELSVTEIEQFTGLKDVNGVDIYEGDMITSHQFLFDGNEVESIIFGVIGSNDFGWTLGRIKNKFYEDYTGYEPSEGETNLGDFYGLHEESFEVIGNIHQNPELLEVSA